MNDYYTKLVKVIMDNDYCSIYMIIVNIISIMKMMVMMITLATAQRK